jgi:predicted nucleic-acid-binding protein
MIALDTNVIARFYVDDPSDPEAVRQRPMARRVFEQAGPLFVPRTVVLELEWVLRAFYGFTSGQFVAVVHHLAGLPHVTLESAPVVLAALEHHASGLDFADALHLGASTGCEAMLSFDDRKFARRVAKLKLQPAVRVPG